MTHNELQQWCQSALGRECLDQARSECQEAIANLHRQRLRRPVPLSSEQYQENLLQHGIIDWRNVE